MSTPITVVDAFTASPFAGNPAAVCLLQEPRPDHWMQLVAREMNLSETAFLLRDGSDLHLRWFTPTVEVDLCGHATLATAHLLYSEGLLAAEETARFQTRSGELRARRNGKLIELDFPPWPEETVTPPAGLAEALGATPQYTCRSHDDLVVIVDSEETVRGLEPDMGALRPYANRIVSVTARASGAEFDFVSRCFGPAVAIPEDPVCGSAHCCLGPLWRARLGRDELRAYQASPRGGVLEIRCTDERVYLGGQAVTVWRGELLH